MSDAGHSTRAGDDASAAEALERAKDLVPLAARARHLAIASIAAATAMVGLAVANVLQGPSWTFSAAFAIALVVFAVCGWRSRAATRDLAAFAEEMDARRRAIVVSRIDRALPEDS